MESHTPREASAVSQLRLLIRLWWLRHRRRARRANDLPQLSRVPIFLLILALAALNLTHMVWGYTSRDVERSAASFGLHMLGALAVGLGWGMLKATATTVGNKSRGDDLLATLPFKLGPRLGFQLVDTLWLLPAVLAIPAGAIMAQGGFKLASAGLFCLSASAFWTLFVAGYSGVIWVRVWGRPTVTRWSHYAAIAWMFIGSALVLLPIGLWLAKHPQPLAAQITEFWLAPPSQLLFLIAACAAIAATSVALLWLAERSGYDRLDFVPRAVQPRTRQFDPRALARTLLWRQGGRGLSVLFGFGVIALVVWLCVHPEAVRSSSLLVVVWRLVFVFGATQLVVLASRAAAADQQARPLLCALPLSPVQWLSERFSALNGQLRPTLWMLMLLIVASFAHSHHLTYRLIVSALALVVAVPGVVSAAYLAGGGPSPDSPRSPGDMFALQLVLMPLFATVFEPNPVAATIALGACGAISWGAREAASVTLRYWDDPADGIETESPVWPALLALGAFFALQSFSAQSASALGLGPGYAFGLTYLPAAALLGLLTARGSLRMSLWPRAHGLAYALLGTCAGVVSGFLAVTFALWVPALSALPTPAYSHGGWIAVVVSAVLVAPAVEEAFFRGWLQRALAKQLPPALASWAFVFAAAAFALAHFGGYGLPQLVLGLLAGAVFRSSGALLPSILGHAAHNLVAVLAGA